MSALTELQASIQAIEGQTRSAKDALSAEIVSYIAECKAGTAGLTASAAEVNKTTGVTPGTTPTSLCAVLGTNKELSELHTAALYLAAYHALPGDAGTLLSSTAANLNRFAGVTPGTSTASKALVLGAYKNTDELDLPVGGLKIGAPGAEVALTSTAAQLNVLSGISADLTAAELSLLDGVLDTTLELNLLDDVPSTAVITHTPGAATVCTVTITVKDAAGSAMDTPTFVDFWVSDSAEGLGVAAVPPDTIAATKGNVWKAYTAAAALRVQTATDGIATLSITDASKSAFYLCAALLTNGRPQVHAAPIGTADYGA